MPEDAERGQGKQQAGGWNEQPHLDGVDIDQFDQELSELLASSLQRFRNAHAHHAEATAWEGELAEAGEELRQLFIAAAVRWLERQWKPHRRCPYCEAASWSVGTPSAISLESGEALSPHFPVMCDNCGNTVFINAILAGLLPEEEP